jgi:hypothetical protein
LKKALSSTGTDWETLRLVYSWVHQLAHVLGEEGICAQERQLRFLMVLVHMQDQAAQLDPLFQQAIAHFRQS